MKASRKRRAVAQDRAGRMKRTKKAAKAASKFFDYFNPDGSYTGTDIDGDEPVQDVDDL